MGNFPGRPDHVDFWKLSEVVLQHDGKTEDPAFDYETHIASVIDPMSLRYMMQNRVGRFLVARGRNPVVAAQSVWLDAFLIGVAFGRRPVRPPDVPE